MPALNTCLDLIIDGERGVWHLTNGTPLTWVELAAGAAAQTGVDSVLGRFLKAREG